MYKIVAAFSHLRHAYGSLVGRIACSRPRMHSYTMDTITASPVDVANILADYCDSIFQHLRTFIHDATMRQSMHRAHGSDFEAVIRERVIAMLHSIRTFDVPRENWQRMIMQLSARIDTLQPPASLRCQEYMRKLGQAIAHLITQENTHSDQDHAALSLWHRAIATAAAVIRDESASALHVN